MSMLAVNILKQTDLSKYYKYGGNKKTSRVLTYRINDSNSIEKKIN